jgi:hypothetical protein
VPLAELRPSQLFLSAEKLEDAAGWFDFDDPDYDPLPAFEHEGDWYLSDGHTRAFLLYLAGAETIRIRRDEAVREEYDFDLYLTCIGWCEDAGVGQVADLAGRVVEPDTYEEVWLERCQRAAGD